MAQAFEVLAQSSVIDADLAARMRKSVGFRNVTPGYANVQI